jgi:hypothetical protein
MFTLSIPVSPFHVGTPAEVRYEVTGVAALVRIEYSSTDGVTESNSASAPAPAIGTLRLTYYRPGSFTMVVKATTPAGTVLEASRDVNVVE